MGHANNRPALSHSGFNVEEPNGVNSRETPSSFKSIQSANQALDVRIEKLLDDVYGSASATDRSRRIEQLLRPLGVLSLSWLPMRLS